ncbi:MAG: polysaccharide deacetylase family protein [Pseudomonadota bacterium]
MSRSAEFCWPGGARLAMSVVVNVEEGSEQTIADGDRGPDPVDELGIVLRRAVRNFGNESNYRYGIRAGAPRVLRLLEKYRVPATFTAAALSLERAPELARAIADGGHEACSHGWRWLAQDRMDEQAERQFIEAAVRSIEATVGRPPVGWLSRYMHTERTRELLAQAGFTYHMDDYSDDLPFWDETVDPPMLVMPYALDSNDMKMWTAPSLTPRAWLEYALDTFAWLLRESRDEPRMMSLGVHLRIIGRPGRIGYFEQFLQRISGRPDVWVATREQIARHYISVVPAAAGDT